MAGFGGPGADFGPILGVGSQQQRFLGVFGGKKGRFWGKNRCCGGWRCRGGGDQSTGQSFGKLPLGIILFLEKWRFSGNRMIPVGNLHWSAATISGAAGPAR